MKRIVFLLAASLLAIRASAQDLTSPNSHDEGGLYANVFAGGGNSAQTGASLGFFDTASFKGYLPLGGFIETGVLPPAGSHGTDGFFSINHLSVFSAPNKDRLFPFVTVGYSRLFVAGNAVNYGGGVIYRYRKPAADFAPEVRLEFRDYYVPGADHRYAIRLAWGGEVVP